MTEHRHQLINAHAPFLCRCGDEWDTVKERWVRTKAGEALRAQWTSEEEA